jgi:rRNA pseudouridine-1189 N-methylase Emg1 (Nep1/Mra1 family)
MREDNVIIEFRPHGRFVKVSAMDPQTLTEVTIVGDAARGEDELKRTALNKLRYVLARERPAGRGRRAP